MKRNCIILSLLALLVVMRVSAQGVSFHSEVIANVIKSHIGVEETASVSTSQLDTITVLDLSDLGLTDVRDLLAVPNVRRLNLEGNKLEDISPLANLENLSELKLCHNQLESINEMLFSLSPKMTIDVAFNYIQDFSGFNTLTPCCFTIEGTNFQSVKDAPYFDVRELHADFMADNLIDVFYRGYTNMPDKPILTIGEAESVALVDGDVHTVTVSEDITETATVTLSNGQMTETTYVIPPKTYQVGAGETVTLETGLPNDYTLSFVHAKAGSVEVVGNALKYTASAEMIEDVVDFYYYHQSTLKGSSRFYINKANVGVEAITISAAQQLAYCSDKNLDFTDKPELKAYVATGYAKSGIIWLTRVKQVPANTGFLLMGDPGEYDVSVIESDCSAYYKNLFKGTLEGATIQTTEDGYTNYYLSKGDYGVSFYKVGASGVKLGANRAYLSVPSDIPAVGTAGGTETIKVSAALQVPYYSANSLDFTDMESKGLKAYTATGYDYAKGTIWLSRVKQVPAETGILIMADKAGDYDVPKASVASVYENMFMGTLGGKTIQTEETIAGEDYINYYLSKGDYGISFYKVGASGVTLGENRCYLAVPVRKSSASGTRSFSSEADQITIQESDEVIGIPLYRGIGGDEDGTTSIKDLNPVLSEGEGEWYTLQGQRVAKPGKGLYIKNGRKVVIK